MENKQSAPSSYQSPSQVTQAAETRNYNNAAPPAYEGGTGQGDITNREQCCKGS